MSSAKIVLSFSPSGTSPRTIRCASPSTIAVLPTPGSPTSTGLFFVLRDRIWITRRISASRPMTGSSLPVRASTTRSRPYFSSASYAVSGRGAGHALRAPDLGHHLEQAVPVRAVLAQKVPGVGVRSGHEHRQQQVLDRHVLVLQPLRLPLGRVEQLPERPGQAGLPGARARPADPRTALQSTLHRRAQGAGVDIGPGQQPRDEPFRLLEQRQQQVGGVDLGVPEAQRLGLRVVQRLLGLDGQAVRVHVITSCCVLPGARAASSCSSRSIRASSSQASTAPA